MNSETPYDDGTYQDRVRLQEMEGKLEVALLDKAMDEARRQLVQQVAWKALVQRVGDIRARKMERLAKTRLDEYQLGKAQGQIESLDLMVTQALYSEQDLAKLDEVITLLRNGIQELRAVLSS